MFHFQLGPEFKAAALRYGQPLKGAFSRPLLTRARGLILGGVGGWTAVVLAGGMLMTHGSQAGCCAAAPVLASAAAPDVSPPPAPRTEVAPKPAPEAAKPAPPPVVAKTTQRVDMTPTAAIPAEPAPKPKHKAHKKKKDLDNPT